jgi:DNA topoisomerase-1
LTEPYISYYMNDLPRFELVMKTLIITEKPKVSRRIAQALSGRPVQRRYGRVSYFQIKENGDEIYIASAAGHLYSLKQENEGYDFPVFNISWVPLHEIEKSKYYTRGYIAALGSLAKKSDRFIVATDWDIEGELLGYNALRFSCDILDARRMRFSTLVTSDLKKAYEELADLDRGLIDAGETRHMMDWYWGINISRALMHSTRIWGGKYTISAGRVQTPALFMLVKREREIGSFTPEKFFELYASLSADGVSFKAKHSAGRFLDKKEADEALKASRTDTGVVTRVDKKETERYPPVPFDLGELQSEAYRVFKFNPKKTQSLAQSLYESGLISYPRTSSQKYPPSLGFRRLIEGVSKIKGFELAAGLLRKKKLYPRQGKKDDPAHPAIYPTGLQPKNLQMEEDKLFRLIVHRFIAAFGDAALLLTTKIEVALNNQPFYADSIQVQSLGWMEFYPYVKVDKKSFPDVLVGDSLKVQKVEVIEGETQPPPRYNPASLIRELEKRGLGTKATRADIIDTLFRRRYVKGLPIRVTDAGVAVIDALEKYVPEIIDEELTRRFEDNVEKIRLKKTSKEKVLEQARSELLRILDEFKKKEREIGEILTKEFAKTKRKTEIIGKCPNCSGELKIIISGKTGKSFVGCSNFPKCKTSYPLRQKITVTPSEKTCLKCGLPMVSMRLGRKKILSCIDPNCSSKQKR